MKVMSLHSVTSYMIVVPFQPATKPHPSQVVDVVVHVELSIVSLVLVTCFHLYTKGENNNCPFYREVSTGDHCCCVVSLFNSTNYNLNS